MTVAAGIHHLDNQVEWVHVFETPFVRDVLRGGEFLLTTGIGLAGMSPPEVDALVASLARAGAAGIGFEPSHAPPETLIDPCRHHDLPLVIFGRDVRFVDITHAVHERLVSRELGMLRRAVALQTQLRDAAREGLGPAGLVAALSDVLGAQVLLERSDRTPIASAPEGGLDVTFMDALDRYRQRLPTPLQSRPVAPSARLHLLTRAEDELDVLAVDEAALLLSVALAAQPPTDEVPSAERARLLAALAEGRAGSAQDVVRRGRSVGVDLSRATLWAVHGHGSLERLEQLGLDALVEGERALIAVRGDTDVRSIVRDLVRRGTDHGGGYRQPWGRAVADQGGAWRPPSAPAWWPERRGRWCAAAPISARWVCWPATYWPATASSRGSSRRDAALWRRWSTAAGRRLLPRDAWESPASGCTSASRRSPPATTWTSTCPRPGSSSPSKPGPSACPSRPGE